LRGIEKRRNTAEQIFGAARRFGCSNRYFEGPERCGKVVKTGI
jgi:hypothetical protein